MPRINYTCKCGYEKKKFFSSSKKISDTIECERCGEVVVRTLSSPTNKSKIIVDNGVQAKAVELDREIVEIIEDREESSYKRRGDSVLENLK